jgi:DNA-binding NarL/FixJ family response regulator
MSISIASSPSPTSFQPSNSYSNAAAQQIQQAANNSADTVKLSVAQQVTQLYQAGQQVPQIASSLSLSVDNVNNYLNISNTP